MFTLPQKPLFARHLNNNGTLESICTRCFVAITKSRNESELERKEKLHVCNPWVVERYQELSHAVMEYRRFGSHKHS